MRPLFLFVLGGVCAFAQPFTAGIKLGAPLDDFLNTIQDPTINYHSVTNRYLVGPTVELRLPFGLGVEVDALYRHYNFQGAGNISPAGTTLTTHGSTGAWEFPLLAKYRFPFPVVRPFVDAGVAWDTLQGFKQVVTVVSGVPVLPPANLNQPAHNTTTGFVTGAGLDVHAPYVHLSPEIRYTRWGAQHFFSPNGGFSSNQNQVEVLLGITF
ncbi:MAG: PorT family protein [Acidobacteriia bacterium]|nr:PorT family protein [Terriglobia bacterium]